jgi:hypothetical protein
MPHDAETPAPIIKTRPRERSPRAVFVAIFASLEDIPASRGRISEKVYVDQVYGLHKQTATLK